MAEQRMSLEDAAKLLGGLHPNTVRSRARNGKIPFEKDNSGKWWVFIDPATAANAAKPKPTKPPPMEVTLEPTISSCFKALEATIETLQQELDGVRAERDHLRGTASEITRLEAERVGLEAQIQTLQGQISEVRGERERITADLRADRDHWRSEADKWARQVEQRLTEIEAVTMEAPALGQGKRVGGLWSWLLGRVPSND